MANGLANSFVRILRNLFCVWAAEPQRSTREIDEERQGGAEKEGRGRCGCASARTRNEVDRRVCCPRGFGPGPHCCRLWLDQGWRAIFVCVHCVCVWQPWLAMYANCQIATICGSFRFIGIFNASFANDVDADADCSRRRCHKCHNRSNIAARSKKERSSAANSSISCLPPPRPSPPFLPKGQRDRTRAFACAHRNLLLLLLNCLKLLAMLLLLLLCRAQ